jgi:hypothetical protein
VYTTPSADGKVVVEVVEADGSVHAAVVTAHWLQGEPVSLSRGGLALFSDLCAWWDNFHAHPEHDLAASVASDHFPNNPMNMWDSNAWGSGHWATVKCAQAGVQDLKGLLGSLYDPRGAERAGAVDWVTPREGQAVKIFTAAQGKRQYAVLYPASMAAPCEARYGATVTMAGVTYRLLFRKGGSKDFRVCYLVTGPGPDTLEFEAK